MKKIILILGLLIFYHLSNAQTPEFETTFYFEDAVGNKESVVVGYDPKVSDYSNGFVPKFGEQEITEPFDTVFEVRVDPERGGAYETCYKKVIGFCEKINGECFGGTSVSFVISNKYRPLKISYKQEAFGNQNLHGSFMTYSRWLDLLGIEYVNFFEYFCLNDANEHSINFNNFNYSDFNSELIGLSKGNVPMKGGGLAELPAINLYLNPGNCMYNTAIASVGKQKFKSYPTPVNNELIVFLPEGIVGIKKIEIFDLLGRPSICPWNESENNLKLDVSNLSAGYYFGVIEGYGIFKFIKQ